MGKNKQIISETEKICKLFDENENIEINFETLEELIGQAEVLQKLLDPKKYEKKQAEHMKGFLEPHHIGRIRNSGDLWFSRSRAGTLCYTYFAGEQK